MNSISIIVPVYNSEEFLDKSIVSLINQTYKNIEILCINDGSKDNSLQVLQKYAQKDSRIKVIDQENAGPAQARNQGLKAATGQYIMFCDSDDWYEPQMCERMISTIQTKDVDLVLCDCNLVKLDDSYIRPSENWHKLNQFGFLRMDSIEVQLDIRVVIWNKIFKKDIINKYNIDFPSGYEHDDVSFIMQYVCAAKTLYGIDECLYNYVIRSGSIMHQTFFNKNKLYDRVYADCYTKKKLKANNLLKDNFLYFTGMIWFSTGWVCENCNNTEQRIEFLDFLNKNLLFDFDLQKDISNVPPKQLIYLNALQDIKQKRFAKILSNFEHLDKEKLIKHPSLKKASKKIKDFVKSYILFPYYVYKIYKILKSADDKEQ